MKEALDMKSCLTDIPVKSAEEDDLRAEDYANALAKFIKRASTPVTIGIQGGWGSGKTSLIKLLMNILQKDANPPALCVSANAWEHSLLQNPENRAEVAISLLQGLSEGLSEALAAEAKKKDGWLLKNSISSLSDYDVIIGKALGGLKLGALFAGKAAAQMVSNMVGGGDISSVTMENVSKGLANLPRMAKSVTQLRKTLKLMAEKTLWKDKNGEERRAKIVFFIDDLDRVPPATAVEILDMTKNIFDMPQCVFVLAIDYEVIVKGLEKKFGPKTKDNEREFRQYFDKIIQIPFAMPLGAYGDNLSELLNSAFQELGYARREEDSEIIDRLAEDAKLAAGGIPRGIKRVLNTLSLLQHIASAKQKATSEEGTTPLPSDIEARFIIVALHIDFPEIARRLMERPNFTQWNPDTLDIPRDLKYDSHKAELALLESDNLFNDPWEKTVYCLAADSPWLKSQTRNLSSLLNRLLKSLGGDPDNATYIPDDGLIKLISILKGISVVSIENAPAGELNFNTKDLEKHPVNRFFVDLQNEFAVRTGACGIRKKETINIGDDGVYRYSFDLSESAMVYGQFDWFPEKNELAAYIVGAKPGSRANCEETVDSCAGEFEWNWEDRNLFYYFRTPFAKDDFASKEKVVKIGERAISLLDAVKKAQRKLFR